MLEKFELSESELEAIADWNENLADYVAAQIENEKEKQFKVLKDVVRELS